jgi:hypothetical protein
MRHGICMPSACRVIEESRACTVIDCRIPAYVLPSPLIFAKGFAGLRGQHVKCNAVFRSGR